MLSNFDKYMQSLPGTAKGRSGSSQITTKLNQDSQEKWAGSAPRICINYEIHYPS